MNENETKYLIKFRELDAAQQKIEKAITALGPIWESLKDWRSLAVKLNEHHATEWSDERLTEISNLRQNLRNFQRLSSEAGSLWTKLTRDEQRGLVDPNKVGSFQ